MDNGPCSIMFNDISFREKNLLLFFVNQRPAFTVQSVPIERT